MKDLGKLRDEVIRNETANLKQSRQSCLDVKIGLRFEICALPSLPSACRYMLTSKELRLYQVSSPVTNGGPRFQIRLWIAYIHEILRRLMRFQSAISGYIEAEPDIFENCLQLPPPSHQQDAYVFIQVSSQSLFC